MRGVVLLVHRWLGLTAGLIFAIASLTGGILVYQDELDVLLGGPRFRTTPGLIPTDEIEAAIQRARPESRPVRVIWPAEGANILNVRVAADGRQQDLVLDAGSGAVLRPRPIHLLIQATRRLHANMLLGPVGSGLVLFASGASVVSLVLGLWLWWPGLHRLAQSFRIRWHRGLYAICFDLHQTLGLMALPLLLVMTLSGVFLNVAAMDLISRMLHGSQLVNTWTTLKSVSSDPAAPDIGLAEATRRARAGDERAALTRVEFPATKDGVVAVWMRDKSAGAARTIRVALARQTGEVLARQQLLYDANTNARLHFGSIGGPAIRALYAIACLVGFSLLPTAFTTWWIRRKRQMSSRVSSRDRIAGFTG